MAEIDTEKLAAGAVAHDKWLRSLTAEQRFTVEQISKSQNTITRAVGAILKEERDQIIELLTTMSRVNGEILKLLQVVAEDRTQEREDMTKLSEMAVSQAKLFEGIYGRGN